MPQAIINKEKCKGCEICKNMCPQKIIGMSKKINVKGYCYAEVIDAPRCIACKVCAISCPDQAIEIGVNGACYKFFEY